MIQVDCVLDARAALGEAALWCEREQVLWWADIEGCALHRFDPATGQDTQLGRCRAGSAALPCARRAGSSWRSRTGSISSISTSGRLEAIVDPEADKPGNRFNDGTTDPAGPVHRRHHADGPA